MYSFTEILCYTIAAILMLAGIFTNNIGLMFVAIVPYAMLGLVFGLIKEMRDDQQTGRYPRGWQRWGAG